MKMVHNENRIYNLMIKHNICKSDIVKSNLPNSVRSQLIRPTLITTCHISRIIRIHIIQSQLEDYIRYQSE